MKDKEELLKKIQLLEQNMLSDYNIQPISDQEKKKFKEYRNQQLKLRDEQKKKSQFLEDKKKEEEDLLTKDRQYNDIQLEISDKK